MNTAWIVLGLVFILVVIDWMIGRHTIKRCETEMVNALKHADKMVDGSQRNHFESGRLIKAEVDEKLSAQNTNVIQELRKETAGMKEWVEARIIAHEVVEGAIARSPIFNKPAEVKLTLDFKGIKK